MLALESTCTAAGSGRLKIEPRVLSSRSGGRFSDFTWHAGDEVVGFLGIYQWKPAEAEVTGMVHPSWQSRGIFSGLFDAAMAELERRQTPVVLAVMDRCSDSGRSFVTGRGGVLHHSEHRMEQRRKPPDLDNPPSCAIRPGTAKDREFISRCLAAAFGDPLTASGDEPHYTDGSFVVERRGEAVGVLRVDRAGHGERAAGLYGFAILPEHQGRGIGRRALAEVTRSLREEGVERIFLEVAVSNDSALKVYESCGFERTGTDDYFEIAAAGGGKPAHPACAP